MERAGAHMHVASTSIFEGPAPTHAEFRDHIASRLHLVPRFRQKLRFVPFAQGRPVWVDDPHLNLDYHVRQTALPAPGSEEQLRNLAARIFSQQLDRSKPLWELWLVEGLRDDRFAIVGKSHHALVDGVSGVDITTVLFDLDAEPQGPAASSPPWLARPEPTDLNLVTDAIRERLTSPKEIARGVRAALRGPRKVLEGVGATSKVIGAGMAAPSSVFNVEIGPHRRFAITQADLARAEAGQGRPRRHRQRRHPLDRRRRHRQVPAGPRPRDRGPGAAGAGAGQRPRRGGARRPRQPHLGDDGAAAGLVARTRSSGCTSSPARWAT